MGYYKWAKQEYPYKFQEDHALDEALDKLEICSGPSIVKRREDQSTMFELEVEDPAKKGKTSPRGNGHKSKDADEWSRYELQCVDPAGATALRRDTEFVDKLVKVLQASDYSTKEKKALLIHAIRALSLVLAKGKFDQSSQDISNASPLSNLLIMIVR